MEKAAVHMQALILESQEGHAGGVSGIWGIQALQYNQGRMKLYTGVLTEFLCQAK